MTISEDAFHKIVAWEDRKLADDVSLISGQHVMARDVNTRGEGVAYLTGPADFPHGTINQTKFTTRPTKMCQAGDILLTVKGSGAGSLVRADQQYCISRQLMAIRPRNWDARFLYYSLQQNSASIKEASAGLIPGLSRSDILDQLLPIPSASEEQHSIAAALQDSDDLIATIECLIAKKQAIKQGMMQELLTGRTRLPGFKESWRESTIGGLARVTGGGTPATGVNAYWGGGIPWFTPAEVQSSGSGLVSRSARTITPEGLARSAASLLPAGTVLVTSRASIGNCAVAAVPVTTNQGFASMIPKDPRSAWFLYYWTQQNKSEFESRAAGSTFLEISASKVSEIPLDQPSIEEQAAIGAVIRDGDAEIDTLRARLAKARAIKTGMMQQLLTGRTRLPVEAAS